MTAPTTQNAGPTSPTNATGKGRRARKARSHEVVTARTPRGTVYRYGAFLDGLAKHQSEAGFPALFADGALAEALNAFVADVALLGQLKDASQVTAGLEAAAYAQAAALFDQAVQALVGWLGTASGTLTDFGIKPKRPRASKARTVVAAPGTPRTPTDATAGGSTSAGPGSTPTAPASSTAEAPLAQPSAGPNPSAAPAPVAVPAAPRSARVRSSGKHGAGKRRPRAVQAPRSR
jgi:hypothetical protein